ncbi:MAG: SH3 domain-containing protein [Nitrospirota bacterium]|nr:SH3 domain-containing protein [Nitrospirota bacterium]
MKKIIVFAMMLVLVAVTAAIAEEVYVQSAKVKVMWEPSFKAKVMTEVTKGHKFTVLGKQGSWVKVKHGFETGYVPALLVSKNPPLAVVGLVKADESEIKDSVRRRASTYTSAAAARGLTSESRKRLSKEEKADYTALDKIESFSVSNEELAKFMEGGSK